MEPIVSKQKRTLAEIERDENHYLLLLWARHREQRRKALRVFNGLTEVEFDHLFLFRKRLNVDNVGGERENERTTFGAETQSASC